MPMTQKDIIKEFEQFKAGIKSFNYKELRGVPLSGRINFIGKTECCSTKNAANELTKLFSLQILKNLSSFTKEMHEDLKKVLSEFKHNVQKIENDYYNNDNLLADLRPGADWVIRFQFMIEYHLDNMPSIRPSCYGAAIRNMHQLYKNMEEKKIMPKKSIPIQRTRIFFSLEDNSLHANSDTFQPRKKLKI